jgi:O-succinylbenzoic acid--CoA ligase
MSGNLVPDWLSHHARATPDRTALVAGDVRWSWAELDRRTGVLARRLATVGVRIGERVGVLLANGPDFVLLVHALIRLRAVLVPLNTRLATGELVWQAQDAGLRLLVYDESNAASGVETARIAAVPALPIESLCARDDGEDAHTAAGPMDLAMVHGIVYTSGTTGRPKGAILSYANHFWSATGSAANLGVHRDDRWLAVLPFYHVGGLAILMRSAIYGTPVVVQPRFDPVVVNEAIDRGVTLVSVVSTMLRRMLDERGGRRYPSSLRAVLLGGGTAPIALLEECARIGVPVLQTYGMTETASQAVTLAPEDALLKPGSAGKPLLPTELRIEAGEIQLRGPNVSPGYHNHPPAAGRTPEGWLCTSDLGQLDEDGFLFVLDRRDDLIVSGGENVYPAEVEAALLAHPAVLEAGVTGRPDARWSAVPVASVALRPGHRVSAEELQAFCRHRLAGYKMPVEIEFVAELPRTGSGKLQRRSLRDRWAAR